MIRLGVVAFALALLPAVSVAQLPHGDLSAVKILFLDPADPPPGFRGYLPRAAWDGNLVPLALDGSVPQSDSRNLRNLGSFEGSFADRVKDHVLSVTVRWSDLQAFKNQRQVDGLLREILSSQDTRIYSFHVWSWGDASPRLMATVQHRQGAQGRLVLWCPSPALYWAYQDQNGIWVWGSSLRSSCESTAPDR
jgi:hypothetical protein